MMNKHYLVPAAIAAVVHGLIFVDSNGAPNPPPKNPGEQNSVVRTFELPPPVVPEDEDPIRTSDSGARKGEVPPPSTEIIDDSPSDRIPIEAEMPGPRPHVPTEITHIPSMRGIPEGVLEGVGYRPGAKIFGIDSLDNSPRVLAQPAPHNPMGLEGGTATVQFSVDTRGRVYDAEGVRASDPQFLEEAVAAVRNWRFEPGTRKGRKVPFRMVQSFVFRTDV